MEHKKEDFKRLSRANRSQFEIFEKCSITFDGYVFVVWRNKPDLDTMSFDDLYNIFKIVEQEVKGTASSSSSLNSQNMAFVSSPSSTNEVILLIDRTSNQDSRNMNQDISRKTVNVEETSSKAMLAIDGASFNWSYMADDEVPTNMILMAFSDSETSKNVSEDTSNEVRESPDAPMVEKLVSDDKLEKKTVFPTIAKIEFWNGSMVVFRVKDHVDLTGWYSSGGSGLMVQRSVLVDVPNWWIILKKSDNSTVFSDEVEDEEDYRHDGHDSSSSGVMQR
ncbi:hypothetical protein Tco_0777155 [Tanacetum coccineum]